MPDVNEIIDSIVPQRKEKTDASVWEDILKVQLDGVMMHVKLFEEFSAAPICGYAAMHKHHAEEEFAKYLHVTGDYINAQKIIPVMSNVVQPNVVIEGDSKEEIMIKGIEAYENWEKLVCEHLKKAKENLKEGKEYVDHLIEDVHCELKCIHLMENDLMDGKYEELDNYLIKHYS